MIVRHASENDFDAIIKVARPVWEEMHSDPWNEPQVRTALRAVTHSPQGLLIVLDRDGEISGAMAIWSMPSFFGGVPVACELGWFVAKDAIGYGLRLLTSAETWARSIGAVRLKVSVPHERLAAALARRGYVSSENIMEKVL